MAEIISAERSARAAGPGLSYWLGSKVLSQPLAIEPLLYARLQMAVKNGSFDPCRVHFGKREKHGKVGAEYHDTKSGKRKRESADSDRDSDAVYTHRHATGGKAEARQAARGRARFLKSGGLTTSVTVEGNPLIKAGAPMSYLGVRPQVDGLQFVIESATHSFSRGASYRTEIRARGKDGSDTNPGSGDGASGSGGAAGADAGGANTGGTAALT